METCRVYTYRSFCLCSYRTYEEWKPSVFPCVAVASSPFLPYLWGMETLYRVRSTWTIWLVLTVPMRNGNSIKKETSKLGSLVLTVPMRNGNHWQGRLFHWARMGSYRTYEEWKQTLFDLITVSFLVLTVPMRNGNDKVYSLRIAWA